MRAKLLKSYTFSKRIITQDEEANTIVEASNPQTFQAYIYPATGSVQAQQHGKELGYVLNMITHDERLEELDFVSVYKENDYQVIAIKRFSEHLEIELKKV